MKLFSTLNAAALFAFPMATAAAATELAPAMVDYSGRMTVAGQPFSGKGIFKFVLLGRDGTRLWANGDNETPIEEGIPSGTVTLPVKGGIYHVRLGDPTLGMKTLSAGGSREASQVGIWFDDGTHGWSFLGHFNLASGTGHAASVTSGATPVVEMADVLAELRTLRTEVAELRRQVAGGKERPAPTPPATSTQPAPKPEVKPVAVTLKEARRHTMGKPDAPLVLVEFTDYECGYCKRFFEETFPLLKRDYIDTGKLRFVSRNMPAAAHPQAEPAALALLGAAERSDEDYWKMRGWLFSNQRSLGPAAWGRYADEAGLDRTMVLGSVTSKKHAAELQEDIAAARGVGITGTPSFVLGTSDGQVIRGERIVGAKSFAVFESKIKMLLARSGSLTPANDSPSK